MTAEKNTPQEPTNGPNSTHVSFAAFSVAAVALASDLATKWWALHALADNVRIPVLGNYLSFVLVHNPGAAFSLGDSVTYVFTVAAILVSLILTIVIIKSTDLTLSLICGLLLGGALGNLYDRIFSAPGYGRGHVVDFIDYNGFFVGNVADIWIVIAVIAFLLHTLRQERANG